MKTMAAAALSAALFTWPAQANEQQPDWVLSRSIDPKVSSVVEKERYRVEEALKRAWVTVGNLSRLERDMLWLKVSGEVWVEDPFDAESSVFDWEKFLVAWDAKGVLERVVEWRIFPFDYWKVIFLQGLTEAPIWAKVVSFEWWSRGALFIDWSWETCLWIIDEWDYWWDDLFLRVELWDVSVIVFTEQESDDLQFSYIKLPTLNFYLETFHGDENLAKIMLDWQEEFLLLAISDWKTPDRALKRLWIISRFIYKKLRITRAIGSDMSRYSPNLLASLSTLPKDDPKYKDLLVIWGQAAQQIAEFKGRVESSRGMLQRLTAFKKAVESI